MPVVSGGIPFGPPGLFLALVKHMMDEWIIVFGHCAGNATVSSNGLGLR